jgi:hypothetical protein
MAVALAYHDIGLWTDGTLAYLEPSMARADEAWSTRLEPEAMQLVRDIIHWHHKVTPFQGPFEEVRNRPRPEVKHSGRSVMLVGLALSYAFGRVCNIGLPLRYALWKVVNAVRRGDWIDASNGAVAAGMPRAHIETVKEAIPHEGFYDVLGGFPARLVGAFVVL